MWNDLTLQQKSEIMKMAISQGLTDLSEIKKMYDSSVPAGESTSYNNTYDSVPNYPSPKDVRYDHGGYLKWKKKIKAYKDLDIDNDNTYDYEGFYNSNPKRAYEMLKEDPKEHFVDNFKTAFHPTFSVYSNYSGKYDPVFNPDALVGGTWEDDDKVYRPNLPAYTTTYERENYLRPEGYLRELADDQYSTSLPEITVTPKESYYAEGGPLGNMYKGTGSKSQKLDIWRSGAWSSDDLAKELLRLGVRARVTSKARSAKQQAKFNTPANKSWHVRGKAIDIVPTTNWDDLKLDLLKPEVRALFESAGIGVLDERPASVQKKTGATGAHFHIGPDTSARKNYSTWLKDYDGIHSKVAQDMLTAKWVPPVQDAPATQTTQTIPLFTENMQPTMEVPAIDSPTTQFTFADFWDKVFPQQPTESYSSLQEPLFDLSRMYTRPRVEQKAVPAVVQTPNLLANNDYLLFEPMRTLRYGGNQYNGGGSLNKVKTTGAVIRGEKVGPTYNKKKKRWYNAKGQELMLGKGYYSKNANKYILYGSDGTVSRYTPIQWAEKKNRDIVTARKRLEKKYRIPVINSGENYKITQRGYYNKTRGAIVNSNQVDSILKYGKIVGIPKWEALGLADQESAFNSADSRRRGAVYGKSLPNNKWEFELDNENYVSPVLMTSDWSYISDNPYNDYLSSLKRIKDPKKREQKAKEGVQYLEKQAKNFEINIPPLLHAFEKYKAGNYNPGDTDYKEKVRKRGYDLQYSPEMMYMIDNSAFNYALGGNLFLK